MGKLVFRVASDWQEVIRLRTEIEKLKQTLLSMDSTQSPDTFKKLNVQLGESTKKMNILISDAAKVGATMENDFKKGIYDGEKAVNSLSEEIIKQKNIIRETQNDVSMLTEQYKKLGKYDPKRQSLSDELKRAKAALGEQKYALGELQSQQALARLSTKALKDEYALFKDESKAVITVNEGVGVSFKKTLAAIGGIAMLKQVASNIVSTAGMFQKYESVLTNALNGSSDKAKAYLSDINSFAAKTNFQLDELTDDFIKFVNRGVTPSMDAMKRMGDFTNTVAKPFDQLTEAILDINNPERWKEFGVRVQTEGNKVKLSFRDMTVECDSTVESVMKAVEQFGSMKGVEGSTEAIAKTIEGQMSNLEDTITTALAEIGLANQGLISGSISAVDTIVKNYDIIGKSVLALIEIYGVYRAGLLINTIVEQGSVKSIWAKITATKAATVAQAAYNKVLAMNPYVVVGMAVVSLGIAMWTLADSTTAAEKAQKRFNDEQEKFNKQQEERKQKIEELIRAIQDETETEYAKIKAYEELQQYSPALVAAYSREELATLELAKSQKVLNKERDNINYENIISNINRLTNQINEQNRKLRLGTNQGFLIQNKFNEDKSVLEQELNKYKKQLDEYNRLKKQAEEDAKPVKVKLLEAENNRDQIQAEFDKAKKKLEEEQEKLKNNPFYVIPFHIQIEFDNLQDKLAKAKDIVTQLLGGSAKPEIKNKSYWEKLKKDTQAQLEALSDVEAAGKKGLALKQKIAEYDKKINAFSTNTSSQESAAEKLRQQTEKYNLLLNKQALEQQRFAEDLQMKVDESRIKAMNEGSKKTIAQMELNFEKEMQAIDRQKEDALRKKIEDARSAFESNPKNKGKSFDATGIELSDDENKYFDELYKAAIANNEKAYSELANQYLSYTDQRLAIEKKFNDDVALLQEARKRAEAKGDTDEVAKIDRSIGKRTETKNEDVFKLDAEQFKKSMNWEQVFGNLDKVSTDTLKKLKSNLKDFISAQKDLSPENLKELVDAIERIDDKVSERNPFEAMSTSFKSLKTATDAEREAQEAYNKALKEDTDEEKKNAKATLESAKNNKQKALSEATTALHKGVDEIGRYVEAGNQVIGIMETLGVKTPEWLEGAMSGFGEMLNGLEKMDLTKPMSIVTGGLQTIKGALTSVVSLGGLIPGFGGADYSRYNKMKEEYDTLVDVWDTLISKKQQYIDISYGDEARKVGQETLDLLDKKAKSNVTLGLERLNAGASIGSHSIGVRQRKGMSKEGWDELRKAAQSIGFDYNSVADGRMTGLFDLTADQLSELQDEAPTFWAKLDGDVQEYLQNVIDCNTEIESMKDKLNETMTGVSFDSFYDSFISTLSDMDKSSKDMADDFGEYLKTAILSNLVANKYRDKIEALYNDWASKSDSDDDGIFDLTAEESEQLKAAQRALAEQMMAERDAMANAFGWNSGKYSQSSSKGGFQAMSQDTGSELNGRFTALQMAGEEIKSQNALQSQSLNILTMKADAILSVNTETRNIADDTRDLIANSYLELVQISENTGAIVKPIQQIQKDIAEVKKNTSKL
ncbi:phage tail tape measure protein [Parabacteroides distasonis]|uniref:Phage tail tape measure protein n=1 Tax=Parabacteroides distasonis TaxID=823 RepID=A0A5C6KND7_PARDI|nr:phage tail tape measure protein [Parabacteroides distasonis]TWV64049.1 phage tail tape measure protein [Parabacteroides distasonis]